MGMLVTTLGRFHYVGGIKDLPSGWDSDSNGEMLTSVKKKKARCGS